MSEQLDSQAVVAYLLDHPGFFSDNPSLLKGLQLKSSDGNMISLMQKQNELLRKDHDKLQERMGELIDIAKDNDRLFNLTSNLVLNAIATTNVSELAAAINYGLRLDFGVSDARLILIDSGDDDPQAALYTYHDDELPGYLRRLIDQGKAICGHLANEELQLLFGQEAQRIKSVAIAPVKAYWTSGLLVLGSDKAEKYKSSMDTLFLTYVSKVVSRLLNRLK